ncbi:hypothetical protein CI238_06778 [Colletotrichum incanum]|uniref:Uncharacterized protein n=1 Tax=Colletotrichum incanum TaxID=1573173 RepID=A0A161XY01_COLIC|nr:hypothetical protein CI238_06778 [Colletotrichum incanum]
MFYSQAEEVLIVAEQIEKLAQLGIIGLEKAYQEGEERDVALVADKGVLLVGIDVEVVEVTADSVQSRLELVDFLLHTEGVGDVHKRLGHQADPGHEINVEFAGVRRLWAGVVVEAAGKYVGLGAAAPSVALLVGERLTIVRLQVSLLGLAEPVILRANKGVKSPEEILSKLDVVQMSSLKGGRRAKMLLFDRLAAVGLSEALHEALDDEEQRGRVGIVRVLHLELLRYLAASLKAKNLLTRNPAIIVHGVKPALDDLQGQVDVPVGNGDEVVTLIPEESSREERPGRDSREELVGPLQLLLFAGTGSRSLLPEALILLVVLRGVRAVNQLRAVEVTNATEQVREHALGELLVLFGSVWSLQVEDGGEALTEGLSNGLDLACHIGAVLLNILDAFLDEVENHALALPLDLLGNGKRPHRRPVGVSPVRQGVDARRVLALSLGDDQLVLTKLGRSALKRDIAVKACRVTLTSKGDLSFSAFLSDVVMDHSLQVGGGTLSRDTLDSCCPAAAVGTAGHLDERGGDVNLVALVALRSSRSNAKIQVRLVGTPEQALVVEATDLGGQDGSRARAIFGCKGQLCAKDIE